MKSMLLHAPRGALLALLPAALTSSISAQTWTRQAPVPFGLEINQCHSISASELWAAGEEGVVLHTIDGGATWELDDLPTSSLSTVFFLDDGLHGWIAGNGFFHTSNGGATWVKDSDWGSVYDLYFLDELHGYACGNGGVTYRTTNGGLSWSFANVGAITTLSSIFFQSASVGWTASISGEIYKSTDGGASWTLQASTGAANLSVQFVSPTTGWAIGGSSFFKTTNGGETWLPHVDALPELAAVHGVRGLAAEAREPRMPGMDVYGSVEDVDFADLESGFACGIASTFAGGDEGIVHRSTDGGKTWSVVLSYGHAMHEVEAVSATTAFVIGEIYLDKGLRAAHEERRPDVGGRLAFHGLGERCVLPR